MIDTDHLLVPGGRRVDDCQPAMAQPDAAFDSSLLAIGTAMRWRWSSAAEFQVKQADRLGREITDGIPFSLSI